jgi:AbiV family abortive infection protein
MEIPFESVIIQKDAISKSKLNADNLFQSALKLYEHGFISPAIPLLILSSEEIIKSFALCSEILTGDKSFVKDLIESEHKRKDSFMFAHKDKHKIIQSFLNTFLSVPPAIYLIKQFLSGRIRDIIELMTISKDERNEIESAVIDLDSFDSYKKKGFYVDYRDKSWTSPLMLNESDYRKTLQTTELIKSIFDRKIDFIISTSNEELEMVYAAANELKRNPIYDLFVSHLYLDKKHPQI